MNASAGLQIFYLVNLKVIHVVTCKQAVVAMVFEIVDTCGYTCSYYYAYQIIRYCMLSWLPIDKGLEFHRASLRTIPTHVVTLGSFLEYVTE
jgi:hypothetical protein